MSLPARVAWIEINLVGAMQRLFESLPARVAWIEIGQGPKLREDAKSLPARVAWIEMNKTWDTESHLEVATREGSVD